MNVPEVNIRMSQSLFFTKQDSLPKKAIGILDWQHSLQINDYSFKQYKSIVVFDEFLVIKKRGKKTMCLFVCL